MRVNPQQISRLMDLSQHVQEKEAPLQKRALFPLLRVFGARTDPFSYPSGQYKAFW